SWRHAGSFRQRTRNAERTTKQLHAICRHKTSVRTHDAIREFEENLRISQEAAADVDDLPMDAEASASHGHRWRRPAHTFQQAARDTGSDSERSNGAFRPSLTRAQSDGTLKGLHRQASSCSATWAAGAPNPASLDEKEAVHSQRPPSPVRFYDYGGLSTRPRSRLSQCRNKSGGDSRPKYRQGICGFYFPGPDCRQGPYGFSMLDPILMPPRNWEQGMVPPERWAGDASEFRPFTAEGREKPRGNVTFLAEHTETPLLKPEVRSAMYQDTKHRAVTASLAKKRDESYLEQVRYETGVWEGRWRDPMLDKNGLALLEDGSAGNQKSTAHSLENVEEVEGIATRIVLALDQALYEHRGKLGHLFKAVNRGVPGVLEPPEFLEGLLRLRIVDQGELTEENIIEVMSLIDPDFDGRVILDTLNRAIANSRSARKLITQASGLLSSEEARPDSRHATYGKAAPVEMVKVDRMPKSLCNFEMSFEKFRKQQRELLTVHNETPTVAH
ncbi:unnamed protein product, partial [Polarella glacialis]